MATPTIPNGEEHFFPIIYSGNGQGQRVGKFLPFTASGTIAKSCMFNDDDSPRLYRQLSAGNRKTYTISLWFKLGKSPSTDGASFWSTSPSNDSAIGGNPSPYNMQFFQFVSGALEIQDYNTSGNHYIFRKRTNRTFEDTSKWYHLVLAVDTRESTPSDRVKLYIDGDQITSFNDINSSFGYPDQNEDTTANQNTYYNVINVGYDSNWDGYMAEFNFVDGQALAPASFGETDTSTGSWVSSTVKPYPTTTTTYTVTVVGGNPSNHPYYNVGSSNKFAIDGSTATADVTLNLIEGATYRFDQSDNSNSGHPLRFSTTANGTHGGGSEYTTGVTTNGTPGSSGAYTEITVASGAPTLYYYCTNHSAMGWTANTLAPYGVNGFRLQFQDSSALGDDTSGNTNDYTSSGLTASDQRTDTPTNNLPTMRPYNPSYNTTQAQGNLQYTPTGTNAGYPMCATLRPNSGKWYAEVRTSSNGGGNVINMGIYIQEDMHYWDNSYNYYPGGQLSNGDGCGAGLWVSTGTNYLVSSTLDAQIITSNPTYSLSAGDVFGIAVDVDNSLVSFYGNNGSLIGSTSILRPGSIIFTAMAVTSSDTWNWNFGDNPTFDGNETAGGNADSDGNGNFYHSVPTGFKMLRQDNMPETAKGLSDFVWVKNRDQGSNSHGLIDSSRGARKNVFSNSTSAEQDYDGRGLTKFLKGGYSCGEYQYINGADNRLVSWNWVANSGTSASNTDGSITSTVQANTTAGFSIVQWTGDNASSATVGHGLSSVPEWILIKNMSDATDWWVYHKSLTADKNLKLNTTDAQGTFATGKYDHSGITSSVMTLAQGSSSANSINGASDNMIAYCWHGVDGFSKFGSYTANNDTDGPFVYTGFKPAFVMVKNIVSTYSWFMFDNARDPSNPVSNFLAADQSTVYSSQAVLDFVSNGFKIRIGNASGANHSTNTHIYMAFAEHPFVGDGTSPVTAR